LANANDHFFGCLSNGAWRYNKRLCSYTSERYPCINENFGWFRFF